MKKLLSILIAALIAATTLGVLGCGGGDDGRLVDNRNLNPFEYTLANMTATDKVDRVATAGDVRNDRDVGIFYHTWHGVHETPGQVLDLTKLLEENPDYLEGAYLTVNSKDFHYWGEPLYGYYCSDDPWLITRHMEVMMAMGIDYLVYDCTNAAAYIPQVTAIFEVLQKYYDQGFNVPKVTMYTNSSSGNTIIALYNAIYSKDLYKDLWYAPEGKPLIIGTAEDGGCNNKVLYADLVENFFDFKESQWPNGTTVENNEIGMPWMDWQYPQKNVNGYMSISLAQHPGARMSNGARTNYGRGWDWDKFRNYSRNRDLGTNYEQQWRTLLENNADPTKQVVKRTMITGFNEWMAQKLDDGNEAFFVDTFNQEYSRDVEMMKGGYDDNYVIQTLTNSRKYRYSEAKHYKYNLHTIDIKNFSEDAWINVKSVYKDFAGDAMPRNFRDAFRTTTYTDNSNRNDITTVSVTHDGKNLYVRVDCAEDITDYNGTDKNWMNLLIKTQEGNENSFGGFNYIINRTPAADGKTSVEVSTGGYVWQTAGEAEYSKQGKTMMFKIPLKTLGLNSKNCYVRLKVSDNVTNYDDIMDYYVTGDSAPIGRFAYSYGY